MTNDQMLTMLAEAQALATDPRVTKSESGRVVTNFLLRLLETLATGSPATTLPEKHHHPEDLPGFGDNHRRMINRRDPWGDFVQAIREQKKRGRVTQQAMEDHIDQGLKIAATTVFGQRAHERGQLSGSISGLWDVALREAATKEAA